MTIFIDSAPISRRFMDLARCATSLTPMRKSVQPRAEGACSWHCSDAELLQADARSYELYESYFDTRKPENFSSRPKVSRLTQRQSLIRTRWYNHPVTWFDNPFDHDALESHFNQIRTIEPLSKDWRMSADSNVKKMNNSICYRLYTEKTLRIDVQFISIENEH